MMDSDALMMLEGVLNVSEMHVRDIMIPRSQMDVIDISKKIEEFIPFVIGKSKSARFVCQMLTPFHCGVNRAFIF